MHMPNRTSEEPDPPTPDEINKLRDELRSLSLNETSGLDEDAIEELLSLPPTLFFEAVRNLALAFGPLSTFPALDNPFGAVAPHDTPPSRRPNPVLDDGVSSLEDAVAALDGYNKLLEEKVAKFRVQSSRSLATLKEASESDHDTRAINEMINETRLRKLHHMQEIDSIKKTLDSYDEKYSSGHKEYNTAFWREILLLNSHNPSSDKHNLPALTDTSFWNEYDYMLQNIQRWRDLVGTDSSKAGEATINRAAQLTNGLVYVITRRCETQLATVFYENLISSLRQPGEKKIEHDDAADIIKDIDELWEEVVPVADMSVSAQFLRPIFTLYNDWESSKNSRIDTMTTYATGVMRFMNDRLDVVAKRAQALVHHQQALHKVASLRRHDEISSATATQTSHILSHKPPPVSEKAPQQEDLQAYMQLYGVVPTHADDPSSKPTPSLLDEYVQNRAHKGDVLLHDLHRIFEKGAKSSLTDRELGGELLLESLLADSAAHPTKPGSVYKDTQLEGSIEMLQDQAEQVKTIFNDLKMDGPASAPEYVAQAYRQITDQLKGKGSPKTDCPKLEEFLQKWGH
ncbi:hypothetical protein F5B22DRAFT_16465 [Xylaria bambusicola]|uniref:uncharacterized protein n=1 Tax=Xylaria bambusicola TaxID=326684 RepID=UPI002008A8D7|nr:uncharacterized protein F5B22DRAFT_16465 [Xylaria bambusicola]KAI0528031.1 hypothetical protein F5B22DRAFT_16465 [Xylaria bambusicola]